jgi:hypothetical protein
VRRLAAGILAPGVLALALLLAGNKSAGAAGSWPETFPLYWAGERLDDFPLAAVLLREDTARYVSFVYGDCEASGDAGCAPPAEVQVWPSCLRSLALYDDPRARVGPIEPTTLRGVPAALFDDGTRLELESDRVTVVVFAQTRSSALRVASALRSLDGSVAAGHPLPKRAEGGPMGC